MIPTFSHDVRERIGALFSRSCMIGAPEPVAFVACQNRRKRFTFTMNARLNRPGTPSAASLSRSSL